MAYKFGDTDKEEVAFAEKMPFGVNVVKLVGATAGETEAGKEYIELTVANEDGVEDSGRVWFVGGASKFSFNTLRQIIVHNAKTDAAKEKARLEVEKCADSDALANLLNAKCVGGELWLTKYYDPERTYTGQDGQQRRSINKNLYGYEPKLKPELMPEADQDKEQLNALEGAEPATGDAATNVPAEW